MLGCRPDLWMHGQTFHFCEQESQVITKQDVSQDFDIKTRVRKIVLSAPACYHVIGSGINWMGRRIRGWRLRLRWRRYPIVNNANAIWPTQILTTRNGLHMEDLDVTGEYKWRCCFPDWTLATHRVNYNSNLFPPSRPSLHRGPSLGLGLCYRADLHLHGPYKAFYARQEVASSFSVLWWLGRSVVELRIFLPRTSKVWCARFFFCVNPGGR